MEADEFPDEIWIFIIENVNDLVQLATLVRTCRRFHRLGIKLLLRELRWVKMESITHNLEAWKGASKDILNIPRKLTLSLAFDLSRQEASMTVSRSSPLLSSRTYFNYSRLAHPRNGTT